MKNEARARGIRRFVPAAIAVILLLAAVSEVGLRFLLFHPSGAARGLGAGLRRPEWYADPHSDEAYWKLRYLFQDPTSRAPAPVEPSRACGWTGDIDPRTYRPSAPVDLRGRRPVLLYGDASADCGTPPSRCFEALLEKSPLADRFCLVNYGVAGYGLDQVYRLLQLSIDLWMDENPIVVIGVPADERLLRCGVGFTERPKPRASIEDGKLRVEPVEELDASAYFLLHPVGIRSYLARLLLAPVRALGRAVRGPSPEAVALASRILEEMHAELARRGVDHLLLAFDGRTNPDWADELLDAMVARSGIESVRTGPYLDLAAADEELFDASGLHNELGNVVAFEALRQGIEGRFGAPDVARVAAILTRTQGRDPGWKVERRVFGRPTWSAGSGPATLVRYARTPYPPFDRKRREEYLVLRPGPSQPLIVLVELHGEPRTLRARAITVEGKGATGRSDLALTLRLDGRLALRTDVPVWPSGVDVELDLSGARELEIEVTRERGSDSGAWVHLAGARIE